MPWYETALVLDPLLEEEGLNERVQRYVDMLTENGAQDLRVDRRGVRKLAYNIKGKDNEWRTQADYTFVLYDAPTSVVKPVEEQLRLDEEVLRFLTVRHDALPPNAIDPNGESPADGASDSGDAGDEKPAAEPVAKPAAEPVAKPTVEVVEDVSEAGDESNDETPATPEVEVAAAEEPPDDSDDDGADDKTEEE